MLRKAYGNLRPEQYPDVIVGSQARTGLCCHKQTEFVGPLVVAILSPCTVCLFCICDDIYFTWATWLVRQHANTLIWLRPSFTNEHVQTLLHITYEKSHGYDQTLHALSNINGLYRCSCNFLDVISVYSLSLGKLPGCFSYERPAIFSRRSYNYKLNAVPYLHGVHGHKPCMTTTTGRYCASLAVYWSTWFHMSTSFAPRPMTMVFGPGRRLCVCNVQHWKMVSYTTDSSQTVMWTALSTR